MAALSDIASRTWRLRLCLWKEGPRPGKLGGPPGNPTLVLAQQLRTAPGESSPLGDLTRTATS